MVALRALAEERVDIEILAPDRTFFYRPLSIVAPFHTGRMLSFDIEALAAHCGAQHRLGSLVAVAAPEHCASTNRGERIDYDAIVLALGARQHVALTGALTFRDDRDALALERLVDELRRGEVSSLGFVVPSGVTWSLPIYELALQTAARLERETVRGRRIVIVTPEEEPLGVFGREGAETIRRLLVEKGIELHAGVYAERFADGLLRVVPDPPIAAERVVALPRLQGREVAGVPRDANGFVRTDAFARVEDLADVYAAGDGTAFPIKQGGIAAQQADAAAQMIAKAAGAPIEPIPFDPILRGLVVTGEGPTYLRAELGGGRMYATSAGESPLWWPAAKIAAPYLSPFLAAHADLARDPFGKKAGAAVG